MFLSKEYLIILIISLLLFYTLPKKYRACVLLITSLLYISTLSLKSLFCVLMINLLTYYSGKKIEENICQGNKQKAQKVKILSLCVIISIICIYKIIGYITKLNIVSLEGDNFLQKIVIPIGLSFYIFQDYSYLTDVANGQNKAEKSIVKFLLYSTFFAKFTSGPIENNSKFNESIDKLESVRLFDENRILYAFQCILLGTFFKLVVAARLEQFVNSIWDGTATLPAIWLIIGAVLYSIQIYTDFAGYTYFAKGTAKLFGIDLTWNFMAPYMESGIAEFWRKWHISLSNFLKKYIYIPLGGNRQGILKKCINTMIVFLICGIWHGNGIHFVIWGLLHGIFSIIESLFKNRARWFFSGLLGWMITFIEVTFAWIFFRAESISQAVKYILAICTKGILSKDQFLVTGESIGLPLVEIKVTLAIISIVFLHDLIIKVKKEQIVEIMMKKNIMINLIVAYLIIVLVVIFGIYGPGLQMNDFIYMQF